MFLMPSARVLGKLLSELSVREINDAAKGYHGPTKVNLTTAKKVGGRLGGALRRAGLKPRTRVHQHGGARVSMHLTEADAAALTPLICRMPPSCSLGSF